MDVKTFRKYLNDTKTLTKRPKQGSVNWKRIIAKAIKDGGVYTTKQFWKKFVKEEVNIGRTKQVLHQCVDDGIAARLWITVSGQKTYVWTFNPKLVEEFKKRVSK